MPNNSPQTLINELIRSGVLTKDTADQYELLADQQGRDFGQIIMDKGILTDADLVQIKSSLYKLPVIALDKVDVDKNALKEISEDTVTFYKIVPFSRDVNTLRIAIIDPENVGALEAIKFIASNKDLTIEKYLISYKDFNAVLRNYRSLIGEVGEALETLSEELENKKDKVEENMPKSIDEITAEAPVTKIVTVIIKHAVESRASDIHIEPFDDRVRIRFRIDGILVSTLTLPKNLHSAIITRVKILSDLKIDETRLAQDGRFAINLNNKKIDFRVSTFPTKNGEKIVLRILDPLSGKIDLPDLGLDGRPLEVIEKAMKKPFGSILITGPTGSGKSTTLAGMLKRMNSEDVNIVTLEDPIEYFVDGVNQSQIHEEIGYTFASGLRHILRQDPDVIMVGEIRDRETAALATQAALTGHIVLSTLHTNDAIGVIPRLIDMGVEKYLIPPTVNVAAAQRLLRRLCPDCKTQIKANVGEEKIISDSIKSMPKEYSELFSKNGYTIYKANIGSDCRTCGGKGYKGRIGIFEMMEMTVELEKIILGTISESVIFQEARRQGMITMFQDGILKVLKSTVSLDELLEVAEAGSNVD